MSDDPIVTYYERQCIPGGACDWSARRKNYDGGYPPDPSGFGATEAAAIADLLEQEDWRREDNERRKTQRPPEATACPKCGAVYAEFICHFCKIDKRVPLVPGRDPHQLAHPQ